MHLSKLLQAELASFRERAGKSDLRILETGTIRGTGDNYRANDGWSTLTFAQEVQEHGGSVTSIDLDTNAAKTVLGREGFIDLVTLVEGYSIDVLADLLRKRKTVLDVVYLDSDNDSSLILHEYFIVRHMMASPGLILVDDVDLDSTGVVKGHKLVPWLESHGATYRMEQRTGDGYTTGVLVVEV